MLLTRLLQDLRSVNLDTAGVSVEGQKRFIRLCSCMEAIIAGGGQRIGPDLPGRKTMLQHIQAQCELLHHLWLLVVT